MLDLSSLSDVCRTLVANIGLERRQMYQCLHRLNDGRPTWQQCFFEHWYLRIFMSGSQNCFHSSAGRVGLSGPHRHWPSRRNQVVAQTATAPRVGSTLLEKEGEDCSGETVAQFAPLPNVHCGLVVVAARSSQVSRHYLSFVFAAAI